MSNELLRVEGLRKSYPMGEGCIEVLRGIDLVIREGERLAILGNSGVGKSTLLHVLGTLDPPTAGRVLFRGSLDVSTLDPSGLKRKWLKKRCRRLPCTGNGLPRALPVSASRM